MVLVKMKEKASKMILPKSLSNNESTTKAGDGIRTHDIQLGKLTFYH